MLVEFFGKFSGEPFKGEAVKGSQMSEYCVVVAFVLGEMLNFVLRVTLSID